ncbi:hypothetical protein Tco_0964043 [Tanacetum coccineum]
MTTGTKSNIKKFNGKNDFALWQVRMKALLEQQGLATGGLVGDFAAIDTAILDEDHALLLLTSLPSSYNKFVETLLYGWDSLKLKDVLATLNSRELQKMMGAKGDGGEGLYVRGISGQRDMEHEEHLNRDCPRYNHKKSQDFVRNEDQVSGSGADGYGNADVMMAMSVEELLDWIMDSGGSCHITYMRDYLVDFEEYGGGNLLLSDGRECRVRGTGKVQVQMRDRSSFMLDNVRNMGFNESGEYKKTFIGSGVDTGSVQVLQEVEFEVEPQEDHTFEVEPHGNVDHELFSYREDSNEAAFVVAAMEKIYAHESLTFNNTVACEVISKWKAGLKDDMDAYFSCRCKAKILATKGLLDKAKGNLLGMEIVRNHSGNTLRVSQSRFYNKKLNGKWSCIYAVGSQEYQMVCTRLDIASADVEAANEAIWLKGLAIESGFELKIVAGIATGTLSKVVPRSRF